MNDIVMPKLSDTMTEGRIVSWKKKVGDAVRRGEVIAEVETDKANMELESYSDGVLLEIKVHPGEMAEVGTVIAVIGKAGEKPAETAAAPGGGAEGGKGEPEAPLQPETPPEAKAPQAEETPFEAKALPEKEAPAKAEAPPKGEAPKGEAAPTSEAAQPQASTGEERPGKKEPEAEPKEPPLERAMEQGGFQALEPGEVKGEKGGEEFPAPAPAEAAPSAGAPAQAAGGPAQPQEFREKAAPVVRRKARELGIELSQVKGSGPDGRILLQDLERLPQGQAEAPAPQEEVPAQSQQQAPAGEEPQEQPKAQPPAAGQPRPMSRLRAAVAKVVSESWDSIPHFSVTMDIVMDDADSIRRQLKQNGMGVTVNDLVVKACALALKDFPNLNAAFATGGIQFRDEINIGVAVGVPDGVLMPVIRGCQNLSLQEISRAAKGLAEKARSNTLGEQDMSGGTFSVSNLGMFGISQFTAIIFPSQGAVLSVGAVLDTVVVRSGQPAVAKVMKVTLNADHRIADGALVAEFLVKLKQILENPVLLLM